MILTDYEVNEIVARILYPTATEFIKTDGESSLMVYYMKDGFINMSNCIDAINDDALAFRLMVEMLKAGCVIEHYKNHLEVHTPNGLTHTSTSRVHGRRFAETFILMNQHKEG